LRELKDRLDRIAWHEQVDGELRERRSADSSPPSPGATDGELRALAEEADARLLDALEREPGYLVWALRLAAFVEPDLAPQRARRYIGDPDWTVRHWASAIAGSAKEDKCDP
jgi:hypothetical protein